jgi:DNA methylase/ParB-like nuclease domain
LILVLNRGIFKMDIKIDKEYAKLVPSLTDKEYQGMKLSIEVDGQHYPIIVNEQGIILDGHHRLKACTELKREPRIEVVSFPSQIKEIEFVVDSNLKRRHLNDFQKAELGYNLENIYRKTAEERQLSVLRNSKVTSLSFDNNEEKGRTGDKIARHMGISTPTYNRSRKIILEGSETTKQKLRAGKSSIFKEYKRIQIEQKKKQLTQEKPIINIPDGCQLYPGDFMEVGKQIPDNSIDLILTDPPYAEEYLPLYEKLGVFSQRVLKDGGSLVTFPNYKRLHSLNLIVKSGLEYHWQICVKLNGHHNLVPVRGSQIEVCWKSLDWFTKGDKTRVPVHISDLIESKPVDKALHEWEQSTIEAEHIIRELTLENQTVLDPLMGYVTNGVAALKLNRQFIGIEKDPYHYSNAERRLSSIKVTIK